MKPLVYYLSLVLCVSLASNSLAQDVSRLAREKMTRMLFPDLPAHHQFGDEVSLTSDNAAARYLYLQKTMSDRLDLLANWADLKHTTSLQMDEYAHEQDLTVEELTDLLETNQDWIQSVVAATRLDKFELYFNIQPLNAPLEVDDPRYDRWLRFYRSAARILSVDAIRLSSEGRAEEAFDRAISVLYLSTQMQTNEYGPILKLVADYVLRMGLDSISPFVQDANRRLTQEQLDELKAVLERVDRDDPCGLFATWKLHTQQGIDFLESHLADGSIDLEVEFLAASIYGIGVFSDELFGKLLSGVSIPDIQSNLQEIVDEHIVELLESEKPDDERYEDAISALQLAQKHKLIIENAWANTEEIKALDKRLEDELPDDVRYYYEIAIVGFTSFQRTNLETAAEVEELWELIESSP